MSGKERWKWVVGYVGFYEVSDQGRVRSVDRAVRHYRGGPKRLKGKVMKGIPFGRCGHLEVPLCKSGVQRTVRVHRLVALAWIGPCPKGMEVCHGDNGSADNSVGNLSYDTHSANGLDMRRDGTHTGRVVRRSDGVEFPSLNVAVEESGCSSKNIWAVCNGQRNTAGGFGWSYA